MFERELKSSVILAGTLVIKLIHIWERISVSLIGRCHTDRPYLRSRLQLMPALSWKCSQLSWEDNGKQLYLSEGFPSAALHGEQGWFRRGFVEPKGERRWHSQSRAPLACFNQDQSLQETSHSPPVFPVSHLPQHLSEIRRKCQGPFPVPLQFDPEGLLLFFSFILNFPSMTDKRAFFFTPSPYSPPYGHSIFSCASVKHIPRDCDKDDEKRR